MDVKEKLVELLYTAEEMADKRCDSYPNCDGCPADNKRVDCMDWLKADCLLSLGVTVQEWISVKDRLPENYEAVLTFDGRSIHIMAHHHDFKEPFGIVKGNFMGYVPVTHWMPLPVPPKGE